MKKITHFLLATSLTVMTGCVTQSKLTDAEIESRYPQISQLQTNLQQADDQEVDILSADLYRQAREQYTNSLTSARIGGGKTADLAKQGQALLDQAINSSAKARDELANVIQARNRAIIAHAEKKNAKEFAAVDQQLIEMGNLVAKGEIADVREERLELAKRYAKLEVAALKNATAKDAEQQIREAQRLKADNYAPQTLNQALSELKLANNVLEANANAQEKAAAHANQAYQLASRAIQITEIIKEFKQTGMSDEQMVLWYQNQLSMVAAPVNAALDFGQPNKTLINNLALEIQSVVNKSQQTEQTLAQSREQYASELAAKEALSKNQAEFESKFRTIQNIFTSNEAEVYRQGNNVLIRSYGFNFPSGGSEIQSDNFPLLKKIISATGEFPQSNVRVSGHTDDRGSDELNMKLSTDRADKVAQFLVEVGNLDASRVSSIGHGETSPLASNETAEGRASNRRVEILIINE